MIGLLLARERQLRWLPWFAFAGLLLGVQLVSDALHSSQSLAALQRATGMLLGIGWLGGLLPLALTDQRFALTLPIPPRNLLRSRLLLCTALVGVPLLLAAALPVALCERRLGYLAAGCGALGLGLLGCHVPLIRSVTGARSTPLAQAGVLALLAAVGLLLWIAATAAQPQLGYAACATTLALALAHAALLWRMPDTRLTLAAGRGDTSDSVDSTTLRLEVWRALWQPRHLVILGATSVALALLARTFNQHELLPPLIVSSVLGHGMLGEAWRRRQLRLAALPVAPGAGAAVLLVMMATPTVAVLASRTLMSDTALLAAEDGRASYHQIGEEGETWIYLPRILRDLAPVLGHEHLAQPKRPFAKIMESTRGPAQAIQAAHRARLADLMATLTGAVPDADALDRAAQPGTSRGLEELFPNHPWRRRWADLLVLGTFGLGTLLLTAHVVLRRRVYPCTPSHARGGVALLMSFSYVIVLLLSPYLGRLCLLASHAVLARPALALVPLALLTLATWRLFAKLRSAELQQPSLYGKRYVSPRGAA